MVENINSTQKENDTRVVLYCLYIKEQGYESVTIQSIGSDILFILLHHMSTFEGIKVYFDTGARSKSTLINTHSITGQPSYAFMHSADAIPRVPYQAKDI